jgi:hypothetical protein
LIWPIELYYCFNTVLSVLLFILQSRIFQGEKLFGEEGDFLYTYHASTVKPVLRGHHGTKKK